MRILPIEFRKKVLQEEDRQTKNDLVIGGIGNYTCAEVSDLVKNEIGVTPHHVTQRGDKMVVTISGASEKEKVFQMLDRERLVGGGLITVRKEANILTAAEIDGLMKRWLTVEDKARLREGPPQMSNPPQNRFQRKVEANPEEESITVQEVKAKTTQTNFPAENPRASSNSSATQPGKGGGSKGGRGKPGGAPSFSPAHPHPIQNSTPTPTSAPPMHMPPPTNYPHSQPPNREAFTYGPIPTNQWYPPGGSGQSGYYPPHVQVYPQGGYRAPSGKGGKGGKGGNGSKGGDGGH
jgi:hypothetical protein